LKTGRQAGGEMKERAISSLRHLAISRFRGHQSDEKEEAESWETLQGEGKRQIYKCQRKKPKNIKRKPALSYGEKKTSQGQSKEAVSGQRK